MYIHFLDREMTETEFKLFREGKCICCGIRKEAPNSFECLKCESLRTKVHHDDWNHFKRNPAAKWSLKRSVF